MSTVTTEDKYNLLIDDLKELEPFVIAFSGGVDSTFLVAAAKEAEVEFEAVTVNTPFVPEREIKEVEKLVQDLKLKHQQLEIELTELEKAVENTAERCYHCKKVIFNQISNYAEGRTIVEGSNLDDTGDYRPGRRALKELGVNLNLAPLLDILDENDFLYNRGFTDNHNVLGKAIVEGQKEGGIISCIKHFPGYGGITFHPENNLAHIDKVPEYSQFEGINSEMIMVSNVVYKELNKSYPFSFLKEGINMIKDGYIIISDDLSQYSLLDNFSLKEVVSKPFLAGADMLIFSGWRSPVKEAIEEFKKTAETNSYFRERLNDSVLKIIELKLKKI